MAFGRVFERGFIPAFGGFAAAAAAPWWLSGGITAANCIAAYQPIGAADLATSYINLANPGTNNATPGTAPAWDATNGWKFNGTSHYLTTGVSPTIQVWSVLIRYTNYTSNNKNLFGAYITTGFTASFRIAPFATGVNYLSGGLLAVAPAGTTGVFGFAGNLAFRNGVQEPGGTIPSAAGTPLPIFISGANSTVGVVDRAAFYAQAFCIYDITLTPTQMAAVTTRMAALPL